MVSGTKPVLSFLCVLGHERRCWASVRQMNQTRLYSTLNKECGNESWKRIEGCLGTTEATHSYCAPELFKLCTSEIDANVPTWSISNCWFVCAWVWVWVWVCVSVKSIPKEVLKFIQLSCHWGGSCWEWFYWLFRIYWGDAYVEHLIGMKEVYVRSTIIITGVLNVQQYEVTSKY